MSNNFRDFLLEAEKMESSIPVYSYRANCEYDKLAALYFVYMGRKVDAYVFSRFNGSSRFVSLGGGKRVCVDGYYERLHGLPHILKFRGCYIDGHTECLTEDEKKTMGESEGYGWSRAIRRECSDQHTALLRKHGYEVSEVWECEWREFLSSNPGLEESLSESFLRRSLRMRSKNILNALWRPNNF